jgi:PKD repeat protein
MLRINRGNDTKGAGAMRRLCLIAGFFSLLFLLIIGTSAQAADCIACHQAGGQGPLPPHETTFCQDTTCALACHTNDLNRHPAGPATPLAGDRTTSCRTCHDKPFPGVYHPYKINVGAGSVTPPGTVDLDQACGQCHGGGPDAGSSPPLAGMLYFNKTTLAGFAENIHFTKPIARFTFSPDAATSYKVNFSAVSTTCPTGSCTYSWNFGDGSPAGSGVTTSRTYADGSTQTVVLTVSDNVNRTTGTASNPVTPQPVNAPPVAAFAAAPVVNNYLVFFTDASTDAETAQANLLISVNWGDGTTSSGVGGGSFSRTYATAGTFTIFLTARDAGGLFSTTTAQVIVPTKYSISGTILESNGTTPISGATVTLKLNGATKATMTTLANGNYSFGNLNLGTYQVLVYRSGMIFDGDPVAAGEQNPITVEVTSASVPGKNFLRAAFTVTVSTSPALAGVTVYLKQGGATKATATTLAGGTVTFSNVNSGAYQVQALKSGYLFDGDAGTAGNQNPVNVTGTTGSTQPVTFTHTP